MSFTFDTAVVAYDRMMGRWSRRYVPALLQHAGVRPGDRVLDVAAGTGEAALIASELVGPARPVVATDLSLPMLRAGQEKLGGRRLVMAAMDGQALGCRDGVFDALICMLGLMFFPDPLRGLREFRRVLRPGGIAAAAVWSTLERAPFPGIMIDAMSRHLPEQRTALHMTWSLADSGRLEALLKAAGFTHTAVASERRPIEFEGFDDFWAPIEAGGSRASQAYLKAPEALRRRIRDELREQMERYAHGSRLVLDCEILVAVGRR